MAGQEWLNMIVGLLFISGFVFYINAMVKKATEPVQATWLIWFILDTITFFGMYVEKSLNGQIIAEVTGSSFVMILAMRRGGIRGWKPLDKYCLAGGVFGLVIWAASEVAETGIVISQAVTFIGSIPTFGSAWKKPHGENKNAWLIFWFSSVLAVLAVPEWTYSHAMAPITILAIDTIIPFILIVKPVTVRLVAAVASVKGKVYSFLETNPRNTFISEGDA